ncbi:MAG: hypothetical protein CVV33_02860 [Methanomicrobiales archaeon HGW-Methanomicrobiales-4]|nr:MAG: hypothetical protein CVV33_02860 [Methanomicrobiales archaeon HGW-Methanomicrobiales-4]
MDFRSILAGFFLIGAGCGGSVLISSAFSLPETGLIGLLLLVIPLFLTLWYLFIRVQQQDEIIRDSGRQVRRAVEVHATTMAHRYDSTIEKVTDLNIELNRRVYR